MLSPPRARRWAAAALVVLGLSGCTQVVQGTAEYAPPGSDGIVRREPCPGSDFECVTVGVPADHFTSGSPTWEVTFALHRGDDESRGVLVIATGGPGSSGIDAADDRMAGMSPEITEYYDVVFFDQRGVGRSEPFRCDHALSRLDATVDSSATSAERAGFAHETRFAAQRCFVEAGVDPADAGRYATRQAVEDLEQFRLWLGVDQLLLYGESYGTQFQQTYAAAHPEHVAALVLDGVVDLSIDQVAFGAETAQAYSDVLVATLAACDADVACADDAPGSALEQYDRLAAELAAGPATYDHPLGDGTTEERELELADLRWAAVWSMSDPWSRTMFQRAVNAAAVGNLVPLARLAEVSDGTDPETGEALSGATSSEAPYLAVECADYAGVPAGASDRDQLDAWLAVGARHGIDVLRLPEGFYNDLACLFWPDTGADTARPAPVTDPPYPLLLLTADTDVNTPTVDAERVFHRTVGDVALVVQQGGPHVVYGRGDPCVDHLVTQLVTSGRLPRQGVTTCRGSITEQYAPNPPARAEDYVDGWDTAAAVVDALLGNAAYQYWTGAGRLEIGCDAGGVATYTTDEDDVVHVDLDACELTEDVPVDGRLSVTDDGQGDVTASLALPFADLDVDSDWEVTGTFRGKSVG